MTVNINIYWLSHIMGVVSRVLGSPGYWEQTPAGELAVRQIDELLEALANGVAIEMSVPIGTVIPFAGDIPPGDGWLLCDGSFLQIADYPALFGALGVTYGGDVNAGVFAIPPLLGGSPFGYNFGQPLGSESILSTAFSTPTLKAVFMQYWIRAL